MAGDPGRAAEPDAGDHEVMASIDGERGARRLIIADLAANDRWIAVPVDDGLPLEEWR